MRHLLVVLLLVTGTLGRAYADLPDSDTIVARHGNIRITAMFHASVRIRYGGRIIDVDPVSAANWTEKADVILIHILTRIISTLTQLPP